MGQMHDLDDLLGRLVVRVEGLARRVGALERVESPRRMPRAVVGQAAGVFANAAAVEAAFLAVAGVAAREGDGFVVHRQSDDAVVVLVRVGGAWEGSVVSGTGVSYS